MTDRWLSLAIVFATLFGPIFAVLITRLQDNRAQRHARRAETFRTLMATRMTAISPEHVGAINTVEVDYHGVEPVELAWQDYVRHLNSLGTEAPEAARKKFEEVRRDKLTILLAKMATALKITKSEIEIRNGGYAPEGWATRDARQTAAQDWILSLASVKSAIPIAVTQPPTDNR